MNEYLRQLLDQFKAAWQRFTAAQKTTLILVPALLVIGLIFMMAYSSRAKYRSLYSKLNAKDAGVLVDKLKSEGVPYRIGPDGTSIEVEEERLYETRLSLASQNLPMGQGVGFEIFDKTSFGITDFNQQVNYQRALEGELSRTIAALDEVDKARVHLVMPKPSLYESRQKDATASVVVSLRPRAELKADQIRGIVFLASASVEGLDPKNVTLLDSNGIVLSDLIRDELLEEAQPAGSMGGGGSRMMKQADNQFQVQKKFEHELERRVASMLDKALGPNRATVRVSAELKFDQKEENTESYEPVVNNQGIVRSSQRKLENFNGVGTLPGGIPGTESNIPGYQAYSAAGNSNYTKNEETTNYEVNKKVARTVEAPGAIKRLSVAVMVDSLQPQQVDSIRNAVQVAAGLDLARGDQVSVENISFDTSWSRAQALAQVQAEKQELWTNVMKALWVTVLVIFLLLFLRAILKPRVVRVQERLIREITRVGEEEAVAGDEAAIPLDQAGRPSEQALEDQRKAQIRQQVAKLAREKPQAIAMLVKRWLMEDKA